MNKLYTYVLSLQDKYSSKLTTMQAKTEALRTKLKQVESDGTSSFSRLGSIAAGAFAAFSVSSIISGAVTATAEYQKFGAVLTNSLGSSSAAAAAMKDIQNFAAATPFSVAELTDSYVKLVNRGIQPSMAEMTKLGDLASSQGKDFGMLTEALLDAQTGEFERLKEFGISASKNGDKVAFSFKNQTKEVAFTSSAIKNYLIGLGEVQGVQGGMAAISQTLGGKLSNLGDTFDQFKITLGTALMPIFDRFIAGASRMLGIFTQTVGWMQKNSDLLKGFAVIVALAAGAWGMYSLWVNAAAIGQMVLNAVMMANPIGLLIAALAALAFAIYALWQRSAAFRGFLTGLWETIKMVFSNIASLGMQVFGGLGRIIHGALTLNPKMIMAGVGQLSAVGAKIGATFKNGFDKGAAEVNSKKKEGSLLDSVLGGAGAGKGPSAAGAKVADMGKSITGTGKQAVNVTVHVGKLNEKIELHTTNLKEGAADIQQVFNEMFLRVLNSANQAAGI